MIKISRQLKTLERTIRPSRIGLRSKAAVLAAALLLAACEQPGVSGTTANQTTVTAGGQRVTILAPAGFCVDPRSTSVTSTGASVLVSDCQLLARDSGAAPRLTGAAASAGTAAPPDPMAAAASDRPPVGTAMTASVSPTGLGDAGPATRSLADLAAYAKTPEGLALIGRNGQPEGVRLLDSVTRDGVLYLHVEDRGPQPIPGLGPRFWRAFLEANGRLVAVSELGFAGGLDKQSGFNLVSAFARAIKAANPAPAPAPG